MRFTDFGVLHRNELSGALTGSNSIAAELRKYIIKPF